MIAEQTYPLDPNGIPIKPGYRKPFNSETGREAAIKCARARARLVEDANIARATLRQVHDLLTKSKSRKHGYKPHLAGIPNQTSRDAKLGPISSPKKAMSGVEVNDKNASEVKPEGKSGGVS